MIKLRYLPTIAVLLISVTALQPTVTANRIHFQQPVVIDAERERGIQLFKAGDVKGAVDPLRRTVKHDKNDLTAWHYLGLALEQQGDNGGAKKAHEQAARIGESLLEQELDRTPNGQDVPRVMLVIQPRLIDAAESAERYVALDPKLSKSKLEDWTARIDSLRGFAGLASDENLAMYTGKDVTTKARVLSKPNPAYTDEARKNLTRGTVTLRCIFGANGRVFGIRVIAGLPNGLTGRSILAARQIKFIPATKDGRPVSMWMQVQYNFNIY